MGGDDMPELSRYHPLLVTLHWLLAFLVIGSLTAGFLVLASTMNTSPLKITLLQGHAIGGLLIGLLMLLRLFVRVRYERPPAATAGNAALDLLARTTHYGFYLLVLLMVASGLTLALTAGLPAILFGGSGAPLPPDFGVFAAMEVHEVTALLLVGLVVLHTAAALYHQFVRKDGLIGRMSYAPRTVVVPGPEREKRAAAQR
jgi:cytochrome b561